MKRKLPFLRNFNWKVMLVRILINAVALLLVVALVPNIKIVDWRPGTVLILAIGLGVLNAIIKPILQILTYQFVFATYGLLVAVINAIILFLLDLFFPERFDVSSILASLVGGALLAVISVFLEALLGTTVPIVPESETELRARLEGRTSGLSEVIDDVTRKEEAKKAEEMVQQRTASVSKGGQAGAAITAPPPQTLPPVPAQVEAPLELPAEPQPADGVAIQAAVEAENGGVAAESSSTVAEAAEDWSDTAASQPSKPSDASTALS